MKRLIITCLIPLAVIASTNEADYVAGETSAALITPEVEQLAQNVFGPEAASNLLHAIRLTMANYDLSMQTDSGRRAWHGRRMMTIVDTNALETVEVYTNSVDGSIWRYKSPWNRQTASDRVSAYNATVKRTVMTNGIPAALAAARLARVAEKAQTASVTVETIR